MKMKDLFALAYSIQYLTEVYSHYPCEKLLMKRVFVKSVKDLFK